MIAPYEKKHIKFKGLNQLLCQIPSRITTRATVTVSVMGLMTCKGVIKDVNPIRCETLLILDRGNLSVTAAEAHKQMHR